MTSHMACMHSKTNNNHTAEPWLDPSVAVIGTKNPFFIRKKLLQKLVIFKKRMLSTHHLAGSVCSGQTLFSVIRDDKIRSASLNVTRLLGN